MIDPARLADGQPFPMGASLTITGVNFAVFSAHATALHLCLFSPDGQSQTASIPFQTRTGDIWHLHVAGLGVGQVYGLRAEGPFDPAQGHRFNPMKLLLDPYARDLVGALCWQDEVMGYPVGGPDADLLADPRDSAPFVQKARIIDTHFDWGADCPPRTPMADTVLYEAHVGALTRLHPDLPPEMRGQYAGLGHPSLLAHLKALGVTAIELLPIHARIDDRFLVAKGLSNHWGYNTLGFFAPEPRFGCLGQLKLAVKALHAAGIEVILDVVYNHSCESDALGPTLSLRGLDNVSYYHLHDGRHYVNDAGTGNTLDLTHPAGLRLVMDSLRYWVEEVHIDGFRFDLATILGREAAGFDPDGGFFDALRQDPVLAPVKLIAEPWDLGPGGYQLGRFPTPFAEWNDRFRDGARQFWKAAPGAVPDMAARILGSAERFDHSRRAPQASINFVTAHDGFTLQDLVSYNEKHNLANGEGNRDGHGENHSDNMGVEGPSDDPAVVAARSLRKRNLLATLFLSQGVPMLLAGDELGHSQGGNNNAYAQDNATTWIDWANGDAELTAFVARLTALRRTHPVLRQRLFLHGRARADGLADVVWRGANGAVLTPEDWQDPALGCFGLEIRMAAEGPDGADALYIVLNNGGGATLALPSTAPGWRCLLDTRYPNAHDRATAASLDLIGQAVLVFAPCLSQD